MENQINLNELSPELRKQVEKEPIINDIDEFDRIMLLCNND